MGERILVVDDIPVSAEMLCRFLEKHNIETVVCQDREECLAEVALGSVASLYSLRSLCSAAFQALTS